MATATLTNGSMTIGRSLSISGSTLVAIALLVVLISTATIVAIHATSIIVAVASMMLGLLRGLWWSILLGTSYTITHSIWVAIRIAAIRTKVTTTTIAPLVEATTRIFVKILSLTVASRKFRLSTATLFVIRAHWLLVGKVSRSCPCKVAWCKLRSLFTLLSFLVQFN